MKEGVLEVGFAGRVGVTKGEQRDKGTSETQEERQKDTAHLRRVGRGSGGEDAPLQGMMEVDWGDKLIAGGLLGALSDEDQVGVSQRWDNWGNCSEGPRHPLGGRVKPAPLFTH